MVRRKVYSANDLYRRITIQAPPSAQDELGAPSGEWTDVISLEAGKSRLSSDERFSAQQMVATATDQFLTRFTPTALDPTMRIKHTVSGVDEYFAIESIENVDARSRWFIFHAKQTQ